MKNLFLLTTCFIILSSFSNPSFTHIAWNEYRALTWDDFQATADINSHGDASTTIRISAKPYYKRGKLQYNVDAWFLPEKSWYKTKSAELLAHEQLHFDLAELYARKIRHLISDYRQKGIKDPKKYHAGIQRLLDESNIVDRQYDNETVHGAIKSKQASWKRTVDIEMSILSRYSRTTWR